MSVIGHQEWLRGAMAIAIMRNSFVDFKLPTAMRRRRTRRSQAQQSVTMAFVSPQSNHNFQLLIAIYIAIFLSVSLSFIQFSKQKSPPSDLRHLYRGTIEFSLDSQLQRIGRNVLKIKLHSNLYLLFSFINLIFVFTCILKRFNGQVKRERDFIIAVVCCRLILNLEYYCW